MSSKPVRTCPPSASAIRFIASCPGPIPRTDHSASGGRSAVIRRRQRASQGAPPRNPKHIWNHHLAVAPGRRPSDPKRTEFPIMPASKASISGTMPRDVSSRARRRRNAGEFSTTRSSIFKLPASSDPRSGARDNAATRSSSLNRPPPGPVVTQIRTLDLARMSSIAS